MLYGYCVVTGCDLCGETVGSGVAFRIQRHGHGQLEWYYGQQTREQGHGKINGEVTNTTNAVFQYSLTARSNDLCLQEQPEFVRVLIETSTVVQLY